MISPVFFCIEVDKAIIFHYTVGRNLKHKIDLFIVSRLR
jgi:hypothetical protein